MEGYNADFWGFYVSVAFCFLNHSLWKRTRVELPVTYKLCEETGGLQKQIYYFSRNLLDSPPLLNTHTHTHTHVCQNHINEMRNLNIQIRPSTQYFVARGKPWIIPVGACAYRNRLDDPAHMKHFCPPCAFTCPTSLQLVSARSTLIKMLYVA